MRRWAILAIGLAACGDSGSAEPDAADPDAEVCEVAAGAGVSFDADSERCRKLSSYRFFTGPLAELAPNDGVVGYDLNTPLFSDYATKDRALWLPAGTSMSYDADAAFAMPEGAVLIKNFSYPADLRQPDGARRVIETRLLVSTAAGWDGVTYIWNDEQTEAYLEIAGDSVAVSWIHSDGSERSIDYSVPNKNQCKQCHEEIDDTVGPIGPKARHLNRDFDYGEGPVNQLVHLADLGYLDGAPADPADAPRAPDASDDGTGTVAERARAWLDINCAHCHNPRGAARTSGLDLRSSQTSPYDYGVCKTPVAAGQGAGDRQYNIVPGAPDDSILVFRIESTDPAIMMPELGRKTVHAEGVALVRQWISEMTGDPCGS